MKSANRGLKVRGFRRQVCPCETEISYNTFRNYASLSLISKDGISQREDRDCCYQCCWITMYKAGAFDYKMSFLCVLSFIFVSMEDNSRKIKGLDFALTAVNARIEYLHQKSHGQRTTNNGQLFGTSQILIMCLHGFTDALCKQDLCTFYLNV